MTAQIGNNDSDVKTIECTRDAKRIKSIIKNYYDLVIFDGCPSFEDFKPDVDTSFWFVLKDGKKVAGLIKLENLNLTTWIPHIVIKEEYRGNDSEQWGLLVAQYMKDIFKDVCFLVMTPYESAKNYAIRMGFNIIGILPNSIKKDGQLMSQYIGVLNA